jgi:hypothetical protein
MVARLGLPGAQKSLQFIRVIMETNQPEKRKRRRIISALPFDA